ncbi:MAG: hypothetical protein R3F54_28265 [Alphaproteobacteria bacterium]
MTSAIALFWSMFDPGNPSLTLQPSRAGRSQDRMDQNTNWHWNLVLILAGVMSWAGIVLDKVSFLVSSSFAAFLVTVLYMRSSERETIARKR